MKKEKKVKNYKPRLKTPPPNVIPDKKKNEEKGKCRNRKGRFLFNEEKEENNG